MLIDASLQLMLVLHHLAVQAELDSRCLAAQSWRSLRYTATLQHSQIWLELGWV